MSNLPPIIFKVPLCEWPKGCVKNAVAFLEHHRNFLDGTKKKTGQKEGYCMEHAKQVHEAMVKSGDKGYEAQTFDKPNRI